jgi:hypothetical protein
MKYEYPNMAPCPFCGVEGQGFIEQSEHDTERWVKCEECIAGGNAVALGLPAGEPAR